MQGAIWPRVLIGVAIAAFVAAGLLVVVPSGPACGSVLVPGPVTVVGAESELFSDLGCNRAHTDAGRMALVLALVGSGFLAFGIGLGRGRSRPSTLLSPFSPD